MRGQRAIACRTAMLLGGTAVMALAILVSTFGCVNGITLAGARVYYAMARDGLFFAAAGTSWRFSRAAGAKNRPSRAIA